MEIVTIEKRTFELWKQRFENFVGRVDALCVPLMTGEPFSWASFMISLV